MPVGKSLSLSHLQHAKYAIVIEEDLDVSPDFFRSVSPASREENLAYFVSPAHELLDGL